MFTFDSMDEIQNKLHTIRVEKGYTAVELHNIGEHMFGKGNFISDKSIIQYENHHRLPTVDSFIKWCRVLGITNVEEMFLHMDVTTGVYSFTHTLLDNML